jgi:hypothetical protein
MKSLNKSHLPDGINPNDPNWQDLIPTEEIPTEVSLAYERKKQLGLDENKCGWVAFRYEKIMGLAHKTRNPLLAVLAELHWLYFRAWDKEKPIELNNCTLRKLGFTHHNKKRILKILEEDGWISIEWRTRKSPLVTIISGFHHGS